MLKCTVPYCNLLLCSVPGCNLLSCTVLQLCAVQGTPDNAVLLCLV